MVRKLARRSGRAQLHEFWHLTMRASGSISALAQASSPQPQTAAQCILCNLLMTRRSQLRHFSSSLMPVAGVGTQSVSCCVLTKAIARARKKTKPARKRRSHHDQRSRLELLVTESQLGVHALRNGARRLLGLRSLRRATLPKQWKSAPSPRVRQYFWASRRQFS